ncbi:MAG TPA: SpoIID/LytB domain-containing protein [Jatrophihabitans sp.]|nr:SpoIID/LytB domain-containing protein [Jatrophihabitans sp.]
MAGRSSPDRRPTVGHQYTVRARRATALAAATLLAAGTLTAASAMLTPAAAVEIIPTPANGMFAVDGHGNGHGHGLSQYGARGAAIAGLSYQQILAFYYPNTTLVTGSAVPITVQISATGAYPTVFTEAGLTVTGVSGALPTTGIDQYRTVPLKTGFQLQRHLSAGWQGWRNIAASTLSFRAADGTVTVLRSSGARTYRGVLSAIEGGSSAIVVNTLSLDDYVRGVVPSEMPASWQPAAVQAQAVAARSYGRYFINHPRNPNFAICDTTACQVYGGVNAEQAGSNDAVSKTAGQVLTYGGATIFAEFSASNGGITSGDGTEPYFVTKLDPYDNPASGDPYLNWSQQSAAAEVADFYGLAKVSRIEITSRAPGGQWGGLVTGAVVDGSYPDGSAAAIPVSGVDLASALGLSYSFFRLRSPAPIGNLDEKAMTGPHTLTVRGWALDQSNGGAPTNVNVTLDGVARAVPANLPRPDVQAVYHTGSPDHGFQTTVTVPSGQHRVCVTALALTGSVTASLGCTVLTIGADAVGHVDSVTNDGAGNYRLVGWTLDPDDHGGPSQVRVYVDSGGSPQPANLSRPDVQRVWGLTNALEGFDVTVPVPTGSHQLCVEAVNDPATTGASTTLQCFAVQR